MTRLNNMQTRAQRKAAANEMTTVTTTTTPTPTTMTENTENVIPTITDDVEPSQLIADDTVYEEYDKVYRAELERKKRVRFATTVLVDPSIPEPIQKTEVPKSKRAIQPKVTDKTDTERKQKRTEKALNEAARRGLLTEEQTEETKAEKERKAKIEKERKEKEDNYELYRDPKYVQTTEQNIPVYRDDQFTDHSSIDEVNDYTLGTFLMENKVKL